ncbi:MAG: hypothetical protein AAF757_17415 [Cyanobacteria bacterium P01_D01_bin.116]
MVVLFTPNCTRLLIAVMSEYINGEDVEAVSTNNNDIPQKTAS